MKITELLADERIFVLARVQPKTDRPGTDKVPTDPVTGCDIDAQNQANWITGTEAECYAALWNAQKPAGVIGYGAGIVIAEGSGWFCVDLDKCREGDGWKPYASNFVERFPGAYVEVSQSYEGLHVIGRAREFPQHGTRNKQYSMECYSKARFIYVTGLGARGDPRAELTEHFKLFATQFFPKSTETAADWTSEPVPQWKGPADDAALIDIGMRMTSAKSAFGGKASFRDLWTADADVLGRNYPSSNSDAWDRSAADQALANQLAFLTGRDCERIERLMEASALRRDKWQRRDYIEGTILRACAGNGDVYHERTPAGVVPAGTPSAASASAVLDGGAEHALTINGRDQYEATLENLVRVLGEQQHTRIGFDTFRDRIMIARTGTDAWQPLTDSDMIKLRERLGRVEGFAAIGKELMHDALQLIAERYKFDSAIVWLNGLTWDGKPRIAKFLPDYCGTVDDEYTRAVSLYIWTGLAARVLEPGCQLDMVVALHSKQQGLYKSTALQGLVPEPEMFTDGLELQKDDDNFKRLMRGKLVVEIAEMAGLSKADVTYIKRVITRPVEEWIEKYKTQPTRYARRCMLFATTNEGQFLPKDDTGQRRWAPVEISRIDRERIKLDRDQLWAEGALLYHDRKATGLSSGVAWEDAERLAAGRHAKHEQRDVWEPIIEAWLLKPTPGPNNTELPPPRERPFTINEVLAGALLMSKDRMDKRAEMRVAGVLRQQGYEKREMRIDGKRCERWVLQVATV